MCSGFITYLTLAFLSWEKVAPLCLQLESQGAHKVQEPHNFADENKWWTFPGVELAIVRPSPRYSTTDHWIQESIKQIINSGLFWAF